MPLKALLAEALIETDLRAADKWEAITTLVEGYVFSRDNAGTAADAQVAMARLSKEFAVINAVTASGRTAITYSGYRASGALESHTVSWSGAAGAPLLLDGDILAEDVTVFRLDYFDAFDSETAESSWNAATRIIGVTLTVSGAQSTGSTFTSRIAPRNLP